MPHLAAGVLQDIIVSNFDGELPSDDDLISVK